MGSVTVLGSNFHPVTLSYDSAANAALAASIAAAITAGVQAGSIIPVTDSKGSPPPVPSGKTGEYVLTKNGAVTLSKGYDAVVVTAKNAVVFGSGDPGESVLSSQGNLTFIAGGGAGGKGHDGSGGHDEEGWWAQRGQDDDSKSWFGRGHHGSSAASGTVVAGGGNNRIIIPGNDAGSWGIYTGNGDDTVLALGTGNNTISAGGGDNFIVLGGGIDTVQSTGNDTVVAGSGAATITATGTNGDVVFGGSGTLTFVGGAGPASVLGTIGSVTVFGGSGSEVLRGGSDGNNLLQAGAGAATLFGGGSGDTLKAAGSQSQVLQAGRGNETLVGSAAAGSHDQFVFVQGTAGGQDLIQGFTTLDKIDLQGYGPNAITDALNSQSKSALGVTITLSDHTQITFAGISSLTAANFIASNGGQGDHGKDDDGHGGPFGHGH